MTHGAK